MPKLMRQFSLDRAAYHRLENAMKVSISETGHIAQDTDTRVRYFIKLDEERKTWVYCRYLRKRDKYGLFVIDGNYAICRVYPDFPRVSEFNKK